MKQVLTVLGLVVCFVVFGGILWFIAMITLCVFWHSVFDGPWGKWIPIATSFILTSIFFWLLPRIESCRKSYRGGHHQEPTKYTCSTYNSYKDTVKIDDPNDY